MMPPIDWNQHVPVITGAMITLIMAMGGGVARYARWVAENRYRELTGTLEAMQKTIMIQQDANAALHNRLASIEAEHRIELETTRREFQELQDAHDDLQRRYIRLQATYDELLQTYEDVKAAYDKLTSKPPRRSSKGGDAHL